VPIDLIALGAAFLSGLLGGVHCVAMCGGIATGFALAGGAPRPALGHALRVNAGRIAGYVLAGALVGAFGSGLLQLARAEVLATTARVLLGVVILVVGLRLFDARGRLVFLQRPGAALWRRLAPLQRRLLPASTPSRQFALGMLWGWMPCGLSTTLLAAAWLEADALQGALLMAAFGAGTLPGLVAATAGFGALAAIGSRQSMRRVAGLAIGILGFLTVWVPHSKTDVICAPGESAALTQVNVAP
jgi:sulfite exporter TauE/SafE